MGYDFNVAVLESDPIDCAALYLSGRLCYRYKLKRDGFCNPVTHVLKAIAVIKRFDRDCKPRHASDWMRS